MKKHNDQPSLFEESSFPEPDKRTLREWRNLRVLLNEQLRLGEWDYDRLSVEKERYEATVKKYRGVTTFKYGLNKFEAMEARGVVSFLKSWASRKDNLQAAILEADTAIEKLISTMGETPLF